jgi:type II secretory pathway pseudopilin PulG
MELMVVVVLVAILAAMASPSMVEARNDRVCFDYAREYQQVIQRARSRAAGTGAAHLALIGRGNLDMGYVRTFAALDGQPKPPMNSIGPNPVASCKQVGQWDDTAVEPLVTNSNTARFVDTSDMNWTGINTTMGLRADLSASNLNAAASLQPNGFVALCVTPAGVTYAGGGDTAAAALAAMRTSTPFTGLVEIDIQRHRGTTPVGTLRKVLISGGGIPRIKSQ